MITSPSLLNPSGYGSMNILLSAPASDAITLLAILIFPNLAFPPSAIRSPPTVKFFSIPTPPSTITAPVSLLVDSVAMLNLTSAPVKVNWSVPFSSYSIFESQMQFHLLHHQNPRRCRQVSLPHQNHLD